MPTFSLSRLSLRIQAIWWRLLMRLHTSLLRLARPRPISPTFTRSIPTTLSTHPGTIPLVFYTPPDYDHREPGKNSRRYPCIVNFHGGGFVMGSATDDARWATAVVQQADAIVCSVGYRLAPEYPFPTAVEDGADAVMWVWEHAEELGIDVCRIGVSGFSAGGNMAITIPLRVQDALMRRRGAQETEDAGPDVPAVLTQGHLAIKIAIAWYPPVDSTLSRDERLKSMRKPGMEISKSLSNLFRASYLYPPDSAGPGRSSPYLSPGAAPDELLGLLPEHIVLYTCEWDEYLAEAERFRDRLVGLGKDVKYQMVPGARHGWDKAPSYSKVDPLVVDYYQRACQEIKRVFYGQ
ncbi:hypothetical protein BOTBODRAFT_28728 [Botryobasidium botryosum FD-172 SS1]|uniref:Alpha/beta hydrolase fold-3 domain-containing protein n=1 Tax=Botryobasidium botryosum (strain FD-172 SS1) TaxID=930990 RepID=A0A067MRI5_BOTB1|nr:hypothetical protein BOTBODRAFT_28728 [Botryobasidium botryosum FD-172 SS1]